MFPCQGKCQEFESPHPLHNFYQGDNMSDPRSKSKAPKVKESKAPHQQIQKNQTMKNTMTQVPQQKVMRNTGRGR